MDEKKEKKRVRKAREKKRGRESDRAGNGKKYRGRTKGVRKA